MLTTIQLLYGWDSRVRGAHDRDGDAGYPTGLHGLPQPRIRDVCVDRRVQSNVLTLYRFCVAPNGEDVQITAAGAEEDEAAEPGQSCHFHAGVE
jgi:hypothetical protein